MLLTHVEERPSNQTRPRNLAFLAQLFQILPNSTLAAYKRFWQSLELLAHDIPNKFVGEKEFDTCSDCCVDDEFGWLIVCGSACDTVYYDVLTLECGLEGGKGRVVHGAVSDGRGSWCVG